MAEWSKAPHSKCGVLERVPWVRIPPSPLWIICFCCATLSKECCRFGNRQRGENEKRFFIFDERTDSGGFSSANPVPSAASLKLRSAQREKLLRIEIRGIRHMADSSYVAKQRPAEAPRERRRTTTISYARFANSTFTGTSESRCGTRRECCAR